MSNAKKPQTCKEGLLATLPTSASEGGVAFTLLVSTQTCLCPAGGRPPCSKAMCCADILEKMVQDPACHQPCSEDVHKC